MVKNEFKPIKSNFKLKLKVFGNLEIQQLIKLLKHLPIPRIVFSLLNNHIGLYQNVVNATNKASWLQQSLVLLRTN
jgi:hypothetical protein